MEQQIRYCTTSDGVNIAWGEAGRGTAVLDVQPTPFSHIQDVFAINEVAYGALARSCRLIMFDARGTGLSERDVAEVSAATLLIDAEAVIEAAKLDRFAVIADMNVLALSTALRLAIELPERVTHLVLESPIQNMGELADTPYGRTALALAEADWAVYTETLMRILGGWDVDSAWVQATTKAVSGWVDPAVGLQYTRLLWTIDVGDLLEGVRQPTLVLRNEPTFIPLRACQRIAAKIAGAEFRPYTDPNYEQWAGLIRAFLMPSAPAARPDVRGATGTAVILFTDIASSTALTERLGDAAFRSASRGLDHAVRVAIREAGGTPVEGKVLGDGVMGVFTSAAEAIAAARACLEVGRELPMHIGLHAGDVTHERGNVYGGAVNTASRVCGLSEPGEILVSGTVRDLARTSAGVTFEDRGEHVLKGIADPVRVFAVRQGG